MPILSRLILNAQKLALSSSRHTIRDLDFFFPHWFKPPMICEVRLGIFTVLTGGVAKVALKLQK